ncbi:pyrroline-5-carboxylate reductase family protein [Methylobacterium nodulans]|uniref:NADP oxidoreductase coenzyme F420-dependent n=1 Tax=Methylobacterium nodulans (strain LMG 21967 / CNCM I-2342 / ORS 2060) TaxID=460265 RepID=B8IWW2_METNO|nr:pyrroline-5-carboxylate reductase dimerization domain-containing protein [Methylobacterium nodulans]ACL63003.1 NADP oxidoreductase coenzyme F420-dependent [Methylobacterium nodulans ORS 2060]
MKPSARPLDPAPTVGLIGLGRIGMVLLAALRRFAPETRVIAAGRDPARVAAATAAWPGVEVMDSERLAVHANVVVPCLPPEAYRDGVSAVAPHMRADAVLMSVTNAVPLPDLGCRCARPIVKVILSPAHAAGRGVCLVTPSPGAGPEQVERICALLQRFCRPVLADPADGRIASNLAGSAPAILAAFCSAFLEANAARARAFGPTELRAMMTESVAALAAILDEGLSFEDVVARTATPGGTTEAAIAALNAEAPALCGRLVDATFQREAQLLAIPPRTRDRPHAGSACKADPSDIPSGELPCR